ncbi:hypothetical protein ScPMuIL_015141 [Solemya velum]
MNAILWCVVALVGTGECIRVPYQVQSKRMRNIRQEHVNTQDSGISFMQRLGQDINIPSSWDWRTHGAVTPVINQGQSGAVESYVAADCVASYGQIHGGTLTSLSSAEVADCCLQGSVLNPKVFDCIRGIGGLCSSSSYPSQQGTCGNTTCTASVKINGGINLPPKDEKMMQIALLSNPLIVAIDAGQTSFQEYTSGVYDDPNCSTTQLDHMLMIVGYGSEGGNDYWICKNTWGVNWGMAGYIWIARNKNMCGISEMVAYPF